MSVLGKTGCGQRPLVTSKAQFLAPCWELRCFSFEEALRVNELEISLR